MSKAAVHPQPLLVPQPEPDVAGCRVEAAQSSQSGSHIGIRIRHKHKYTNIKTDTDDSTYSWYGLHSGSCTSSWSCSFSFSRSCSLSLCRCRYKDSAEIRNCRCDDDAGDCASLFIHGAQLRMCIWVSMWVQRGLGDPKLSAWPSCHDAIYRRPILDSNGNILM